MMNEFSNFSGADDGDAISVNSMSPQRTPLEVGTTALAIGRYSVGLAPSRTCEQLVGAYLELVAMVRRDYPEYFRDEDFDALAEATTRDASFFRNQVVAQLQAVRVA